MAKLAFFSIPAYGHTNPTLGVVRQLVGRGHTVLYFSFESFRGAIEAAGATFLPCDAYQPKMELSAADAQKAGADAGLGIRMLTESTLSMDAMVCEKLKAFAPDAVIADSMAVWGKFAALKLGIPFISSTTTFAFNRYSARIMKGSPAQLFGLLKSLPGMRHDVKRLQAKGYPVKNVLSILQNENDTNTIVYTSPEFQPCAETFSEHYAFVGPSIRPAGKPAEKTAEKQVYISLGTVNNQMLSFYRNCIEAFRNSPYAVILSVGEQTKPEVFGLLPKNITVQQKVDQIAVLQNTDVFLSHCGMNSVNESLYYGVPLVTYPQTAEQGGVAARVAQVNAGLALKKTDAASIRAAVDTVMQDKAYAENAAKIAEGFRKAGGAAAAADAVEKWLS